MSKRWPDGEERIIILAREDTALVNALQSRSAVILQKSLREGFGLTVAEAMWKGTPVIGGDVGGIRHQIEDGVNGFLVSSEDEAAQRMVQLLRDEQLRQQMGASARETVKQRFLMIRLLEQYLDLLNSFETMYQLRRNKLGDTSIDSDFAVCRLAEESWTTACTPIAMPPVLSPPCRATRRRWWRRDKI